MFRKKDKPKKTGIICKFCGGELTSEQKSYDWQFGNMWFCGISCATAWAVKQHLKKGRDDTNRRRKNGDRGDKSGDNVS